MSDNSWLEEIKWNNDGLIPVIAQDNKTNKILMMAWMNREALAKTVETSTAIYFSRSRHKLWHKGEESGHFQTVEDIRLDCDNDVIVIKVIQHGGISCHTGRETCFYKQLVDNNWIEVEAIIKDPKEIYK